MEDNILLRMAWTAIIYVLLSYYMWYMKRRGGFSVFIGEGGLTATLFSFAFMIISPLIPLSVVALLINSLGLSDASEGVISILLVIAAVAYVVIDIGRVINPNFLKKESNSSNVNEQQDLLQNQ